MARASHIDALSGIGRLRKRTKWELIRSWLNFCDCVRSPDFDGVPDRHAAELPPLGRKPSAVADLLTHPKCPPLTLNISQSDQMLTIVGDREPYQIRTDGKAEKHLLETGSVNRTEQWTGPQLRVAYEVGRSGLLTYNYTIVPTTGQLLIRINFERVRDEPGPFDVKIVYNRRKKVDGPR